jgi:acyl-CoA dehydrogenase
MEDGSLRMSVWLQYCFRYSKGCYSGVVGGLELSCFDECLIAEEIAYGCTAIATAMGASNLGVSQIVMFSILM